jgi:hypothetical protein
MQLYLPCFHPLAVFLPRIAHTPMLLLNRVRSCARRNLPNLNFLARKRCFCGGTETSGGLTALRNPPGVFPMGPSTEETWNRFRNPETWLMLRME